MGHVLPPPMREFQLVATCITPIYCQRGDTKRKERKKKFAFQCRQHGTNWSRAPGNITPVLIAIGFEKEKFENSFSSPFFLNASSQCIKYGLTHKRDIVMI